MLPPCSGEACLVWPNRAVTWRKAAASRRTPRNAAHLMRLSPSSLTNPIAAVRNVKSVAARRLCRRFNRGAAGVCRTFKTIAAMSSCRRPSAEKIAPRQRENRAIHRRICIGTDSRFRRACPNSSRHPVGSAFRAGRRWQKTLRRRETSSRDEFRTICRQTCRKGSHLRRETGNRRRKRGTPAFQLPKWQDVPTSQCGTGKSYESHLTK